MHRLVLGLAFLAHIAFVAFVPLGGFAAWAERWLIWPHLAAVAWAVWVLGFGRSCPLTAAENWGRRGLGLRTLPEDGFMAHYLEGRVYPRGWTRVSMVVVFAAVAVSWIGFVVWG